MTLNRLPHENEPKVKEVSKYHIMKRTENKLDEIKKKYENILSQVLADGNVTDEELKKLAQLESLTKDDIKKYLNNSSELNNNEDIEKFANDIMFEIEKYRILTSDPNEGKRSFGLEIDENSEKK